MLTSPAQAEVDAFSIVEAHESLENVDTTSLVLHQPAPRYPATQQSALQPSVPQQGVSQQLVLYQPAPQQVVSQALASQQLVLHQCGSAQDVFWASWVGMLLRSDALARGEVDIDGLIEAFKSLSIIDTRFPSKKRPTNTRPARHHPYQRSASRQSTLAVRGRGKHIASKTRSFCSEASDAAAASCGDQSGSHIQPSPHPDPAPLVMDAQPSQADNTILDVAVASQVFEPAPVTQLQPDPASDARAALPSSIADMEQDLATSVPIPQSPQLEAVPDAQVALLSPIADFEADSAALVPLPESPQPAPAALALPAPSSHVALPPLGVVEPAVQEEQTQQPQPRQSTPAPLAPPSQKALPPLETVERILQKAKQIMQQQQQQLAQQAELPVAAQPALEPEKAVSEPLPTPTPAPAEEDEEDDEFQQMMGECTAFEADPLSYHAEQAKHAAAFDIQAAQKAVAVAKAKAEAPAPSTEPPPSSPEPASAGPATKNTGSLGKLFDDFDKLEEEERASGWKKASKKPAWKR